MDGDGMGVWLVQAGVRLVLWILGNRTICSSCKDS